MVIGKTERRFMEGAGECYLKSGAIRCQGLSKSQLRKWREEHNDYESTTDDVWPECQCHMPAEPGAFACKWHGGRSVKSAGDGPKSLLDTMPVDLANKLKVLTQNPTYWSRREDILLMQARQWELMEDLTEVAGNAEAWGGVGEAIVALRKGKDMEALLILEEAEKHIDRRKEVWDEVRKNENVIKELTNTQVRTVKDLQQMATTEQVTALVMNLYEIVANGATKYIHDSNDKSKFLTELSKAISRYANLSPLALSSEVGRGRYTIEGESE